MGDTQSFNEELHDSFEVDFWSPNMTGSLVDQIDFNFGSFVEGDLTRSDSTTIVP
jgi:hypothetical protein